MSNAKEICEGVPRPLLDSPVSDIHLSDIASHITEWRELAPYLDLSEVEEKDIHVVDSNPNSPKLQRREALRKWKESNGSKATYRRLICILSSQGRAGTAEALKKILVSSTGKKYDDEQAVMINSFHHYLCDCYSGVAHPSSLQWPLLTSYAGYVDLDLYDAPVSLTVLMNAPMSVHSLKPLPLKSIFNAGNQKAPRKVVLVEGLAGSGKTTLCWYACKEWAAGRLFTDIRLLIHVSCSDTEVRFAEKLADLIPQLDRDKRDAIAGAIAHVRGKGVCLLFDGCDEAPQLFVRGSFLSHFVQGTGRRSMLPSASILLTSRPNPEIFFYLTGCITGKVIVKGFRSLDEFIEATVQETSKRARLLEALEMKPELVSLCYLPLHAVILVFLFDILQENLPTTRTGLFDPLVRNFLLRHMKSRTPHQVSCISDLSKDLPSDTYQSLRKISQLAYQCIIDRHSLVSQTVLEAKGINPTSHDTFGFLNIHHKLTASGATNLYAFPHLSLQEFLAAFHITQLKESDQIAAFKKVYKQNPLNSVLSFYAGLTRFTSVPNEICDLLLRVMENPMHINAVVAKLQSADSYKPEDDMRRLILALMNCIYESKSVELMNRIILFSPQMVDDDVVLASDFNKHNRNPHIELALSYMILDPTDCLSIGYFARHACELIQSSAYCVLNLSHCMLKDKEIKALSQELCKPIRNRRNLSLKLDLNFLTKQALQSIRAVLMSVSGVFGLIVSGFMLEDIQLALKYIIEGLNPNPLSYLSINDIWVPVPIAHHLVLLLYSGQYLSTLNLCGCIGVFTNPQVMLLFCEALKYHKNLQRLFLDGCGINDLHLELLAVAVVGGSRLQALDIGWNCYTASGLTQFLQTLVEWFWHTHLVVLSTDEVLDEHRSLVDQFNFKRDIFALPNLTIGCKNRLWEKEVKSMRYLLSDPKHRARDPGN